MIRLFTFFLFTIVSSTCFSQWYYNHFDEDSIPAYEYLPIHLDSTDTVWQIGPPQKTIFDAAFSEPNVLITDTVNPYPLNDTASFYIRFPEDSEIWWYGIAAVKWTQKLDIDSLDGGLIEFTFDGGETWENAFNSPWVYNFYGWEWGNQHIDTLANGETVFCHTDTVWREIWLCFEYYWMEQADDLEIRFSLVSDSIDGGGEGWMIDNFILEPTQVHTIGENPQKEDLVVYPNPTTGRVDIQAKRSEEVLIIKSIEVLTEKGVRIQKFENTPTKFFVDISDQPPGVYLIKVQTEAGTETHRVVLTGQ